MHQIFIIRYQFIWCLVIHHNITLLLGACTYLLPIPGTFAAVLSFFSFHLELFICNSVDWISIFQHTMEHARNVWISFGPDVLGRHTLFFCFLFGHSAFDARCSLAHVRNILFVVIDVYLLAAKHNFVLFSNELHAFAGTSDGVVGLVDRLDVDHTLPEKNNSTKNADKEISQSKQDKRLRCQKQYQAQSIGNK